MVSKKKSEALPLGWTEHVSVKNGKTTKMDESAEWLPEGWTVEAKRKGGSALGSVYKVY